MSLFDPKQIGDPATDTINRLIEQNRRTMDERNGTLRRLEMTGPMDFRHVVPTASMRGDSDEDTRLLFGMLQEASNYIKSFEWCRGVVESYFGLGVGGVVAVFFFRICPAQGADEWLWVVVGDLPPAYLVTDRAPNGACALQAYIREMQAWVDAVRAGQPVDDIIPVNVPATPENAERLESRLRFLRDEILSARTDELRHCT